MDWASAIFGAVVAIEVVLFAAGIWYLRDSSLHETDLPVRQEKKREQLIILVRHASRERPWRVPEPTHWMKDWSKWSKAYPPKESDSNVEGLGRTFALAGRLCDELKILSSERQNRTIVVTDIIHSRHTVACQTAKAYLTVLQERSKREDKSYLRINATLQECAQLDPETFSLKCVIKEIKKVQTDSSATLVFIVVGHQPQLTHIARELLKKDSPWRLRPRSALPGDSLPLGNSEAACIWLDRPRLLWLLTEKPEALLTDLKDKIKSKYDVAKFFLGAFVVNIGLFLNAGIWDNINFGNSSKLMVSLLGAFGIIMALASLAFSAATLFSYDSLLMPASLWSESGGQPTQPRGREPRKWSVLRPPSQAHVILFYEMMHVWNCFFIPAVMLAFGAIVSVVCSLALRELNVPLLDDLLKSATFWSPLPRGLLLSIGLALSIGLTFLTSWWFYRRWRPRLGTED